jgi:hypothetical protein
VPPAGACDRGAVRARRPDRTEALPGPAGSSPAGSRDAAAAVRPSRAAAGPGLARRLARPGPAFPGQELPGQAPPGRALRERTLPGRGFPGKALPGQGRRGRNHRDRVRRYAGSPGWAGRPVRRKRGCPAARRSGRRACTRSWGSARAAGRPGPRGDRPRRPGRGPDPGRVPPGQVQGSRPPRSARATPGTARGRLPGGVRPGLARAAALLRSRAVRKRRSPGPPVRRRLRPRPRTGPSGPGGRAGAEDAW